MNREEWTYPQKCEVLTVTGSTILGRKVSILGSKIIRTFETIPAKTLTPNADFRNKYMLSHEL